MAIAAILPELDGGRGVEVEAVVGVSALAEQEAIIEAVTANGSHAEASVVTRNDCERCGKGWHREEEWHCRTCHADNHCACGWCGKCLPARHRRDRRFCSSTCRVRALEWRRSPEGQEGQRRERERMAPYLEAVKDLAEIMAGSPEHQVEQGRRERRLKHALRTGETCAVCERDLGGGPIFWRPVYTGHTTVLSEGNDQVRAAPVCADCLCPEHRQWGNRLLGPGRAWLCERCRPGRRQHTWHPFYGSRTVAGWSCPQAGEDHRGLYCEQCHPAMWQAAPCPGCQRTVLVRLYRNRWGWLAGPHANHRSGREWRTADEDEPRELVAYCSQRCRSRVDHERAATRRLQARQEQGPHLCGGCGEVLDGKRADARYCSGRCRQRAYRQRGGGS